MPQDSDKAKPGQPLDGAPNGKGDAATLPLFYRRPEPLSPSAHGGKALRQPPDFRFAATAHAVVLHAEEFRLACAHYPIVFADDESAVPIAILGHVHGRNLFVDADGNWDQGTYVPAYVRRYPFINGRGAAESDVVLFIDMASDQIVEAADNPTAEPLFVDGKPSERAKRALDFCIAFQGQAPLTSAFVNELKSRDMLESRSVQLDLADGTRRRLKGLRIIGEKAFRELPDDVWLEWRHRGWISLVYWHWASMDNFIRLSKRA